MFKKKVPITETPEYKAQSEQMANSRVESINIGTKDSKAEIPHEPTLQEQIISMSDVEFRTWIVATLAEIKELAQFVKEVAESELKQ